jgi:hypothetical protein
MGRTPVREAIGSLRYLIAPTKRDIAYAANQVSAFVSDLGPGLCEAIKRIFAYLSGTTNYLNLYEVNGHQSAHWMYRCRFVSNPIKRKSITGIVFLFYDRAVSWRSPHNTSPSDGCPKDV